MTTVEQHIIDYVKTHDRRNSLLYNNRCFIMYINPSDERKSQYEANRIFILDYFNKKEEKPKDHFFMYHLDRMWGYGYTLRHRTQFWKLYKYMPMN